VAWRVPYQRVAAIRIDHVRGDFGTIFMLIGTLLQHGVAYAEN
jgi:hypothetical protein